MIVVNAYSDPSQPVQGVRVSLSFVAGSEEVTDARDATNRAGQALLIVSPEAAQRGDLRIEITGVSDLVVYEPADGQLNELPSTVTIRLLPKGSVLLLGPAQIEGILHRLSLQVKHLEQENREVKGELATAQGQKPDDLTAAMTEWAKTNGFEPADADKKIQQWAEEIQKRKDQATADQRALAELALKHYGVAAELFDETVKDIGQSMDEDEKKFLEDRRKKLRHLVDKTYQSSNAYQLDLQYHQATQILVQARDRAAAEHGHYPEDRALRSIWLDTMLRIASARRDEGEFGEAGDSAALLAQSIKDYQGLTQERSAPAERQDWATAQINLGIALEAQGVRSSGPQGTDQLAKAVQAYRSALEAYTKADLPKDWAKTQNNLGNALKGQGERISGTQATDLLAQAVRAYRAALEVRTKADLPLDWASTQNNLGNALTAQGERESGTQAADLLAQAVLAYRTALEVQTKADGPQHWARTQNNLGIALTDQAERSNGPQAKELLEQALVAYQAALEVRTKASLPQEWASTENNLGVVLLEAGERSSGPQATEDMAQAVKEFRAAQEVQTRTALPQAWASTQNNVAAALENQGVLSSGVLATDLLAQAVEAYRATLEVYTKTDLPQNWASTENNLGIALWDQAERSSGAPAKDLLAQAVSAFRAALEVRTKADLPQDWAQTQNNLGLVLRDEGKRSSGAQAKAFFAQAEDAYRAALEVFTRADLPLDWATTESNLGNALVDEGEYSAAAKVLEECLEAFPDSIEPLQTAISIYHDNLYRYDRAYELTQRWLKLDASPVAKMNMVEEDLTTSHFKDCEKQVSSLDDAAIPAPAMPAILIRDSMRMACQWGGGQKADAQQTGQALLLKSAQLQDIGWQFTGMRHFLASSPAFETGRVSWIALFDSLEKGDGAAMAAALHQLEEVMKQ